MKLLIPTLIFLTLLATPGLAINAPTFNVTTLPFEEVFDLNIDVSDVPEGDRVDLWYGSWLSGSPFFTVQPNESLHNLTVDIAIPKNVSIDSGFHAREVKITRSGQNTSVVFMFNIKESALTSNSSTPEPRRCEVVEMEGEDVTFKCTGVSVGQTEKVVIRNVSIPKEVLACEGLGNQTAFFAEEMNKKLEEIDSRCSRRLKELEYMEKLVYGACEEEKIALESCEVAQKMAQESCTANPKAAACDSDILEEGCSDNLLRLSGCKTTLSSIESRTVLRASKGWMWACIIVLGIIIIIGVVFGASNMLGHIVLGGR